MAKINSINNAAYSFVSDTDITSTLGDITASQGDIIATLGNITATAGDITATLGDIVLTNGKLTVGISNGTNGQVILAATAGNPAWASITAGAGITLTPSANGLDVACSAAGLLPIGTVAANASLVNNNGYINIKNTGLLTMTLPVTAAVGTVIILQGSAAGTTGWKIAQNAGQNIQFGNQPTAVGVLGYLSSTDVNDSISLVCTVADTTWNVYMGVGNITVA